ncbi:Metal-dependent hydrolase YbeY, involved in rRNA and/or ribosome maturation and assembly [plant metagenome]|uniref:Endoribonuclease YbeY n=2 Tax=root TaxID=1 RepID=A0A1C3K494_9BURK|nr:rRNA maturation RNase YbeY [Orrella dioscoreae]SBT26197.1 Metal-dependent hydrolase YbeY, involved in rRNA and/or ribosome maturation and assembly [Orrella dioscoreae]SOE51311.1 Metal-dependent hydrolase YbeY, involved in rRNA and/or ribosome maturation and assembly [Orrella dioscoreae]
MRPDTGADAPMLSLSVQYGVAEPRLPRWRLRRWVARGLAGAAADMAEPPAAAQLSLRLVGLAEGRRLNREFRERDYATNVLTFEYGADPGGTVHGDIVLCVPVLVKEAREQKKALLDHAAHLVVHGTLHALGYDHLNARDARRMESLETAVLDGMGIADPYLVD